MVQERGITPADVVWERFFLTGKTASEDFMAERASQQQDEREAF